MTPPGAKTVGKAVGERLGGGEPNTMRSATASAVVGIVAAVLTYKVLRK